VRYGDPSNPPLVALHGGPGADHRYLLPQMLHLAEEHELILYDQRGSGKSRAENNAPITWHDHVADLAQLARELDLERLSLIGYSWGGMLAMLYTVESFDSPQLPQPDRLALISPAPITSEYRAQFDAALRERNNTPALVAEREALGASGLRESDPDAYRQRLFELGVTGYFVDPEHARSLTPFRVVGRVQQSTWESLGSFDLRPALARIGERELPVKIVHGRDDPIPAASSIDAARAMKCDMVLIDDCGHVPYVEQPVALWRALDPFLASTDALAGSDHD
jgi:proline iminopeptidase